MVAGAKIHVGHVHRGKVVTVVIEDSQLRVPHEGIQLATHPGTATTSQPVRSTKGQRPADRDLSFLDHLSHISCRICVADQSSDHMNGKLPAGPN